MYKERREHSFAMDYLYPLAMAHEKKCTPPPPPHSTPTIPIHLHPPPWQYTPTPTIPIHTTPPTPPPTTTPTTLSPPIPALIPALTPIPHEVIIVCNNTLITPNYMCML